jgi:protein kinase N
VLYELSHKYGLQLECDPDELKELIRREIRKELKIKEGAEKLREVAKDRRSLADVATIVKKANTKLAELQAELQELESQIILTQGQGAPTSPPVVLNNGQGECQLPTARNMCMPLMHQGNDRFFPA